MKSSLPIANETEESDQDLRPDPNPTATADCAFFAVVLPSLEDLALSELKKWAPHIKAEKERGGLNFRAPLNEGLALNRYLKVPTRILVRVSDFGCRDFPKLFRKISKFPWTAWLPADAQIEFTVSSHRSRLAVKRRILDTCKDGYKASLKERGAEASPNGPMSEVQVRVIDDICTISLDTSGEILHKRGVRVLSSEAPLRETAASALLWMLENKSNAKPFSVELIDPMMGGGTFFLEAANLKTEVTSRKFAFEKFKIPGVTESATLQFPVPSVYGAFTGFEIDGKTITAARRNLEKQRPQAEITYTQKDFFKTEPLPVKTMSERWLIANPPYGERLKVKGSLSEYYESFFAQCEKIASPDRACFLLPEKVNPPQLKVPAGWKKRSELHFSNGGIAVVALVWARAESVP